MADFSLTDAALEGIRIARENPKAIAAWWAVYAVATIAMMAILAANGGLAAMTALQDAAVAPDADPAALATQIGDAARKFGLAILPMVLAQVLVQAGVFRVILAPHGRRAPLSVGGDEAQVLAASLIVALLGFVLVVVCGLVLGAVAAMAAPTLAPFVTFLVTAAIFIILSVRLVTLAPMAVGEGRLDVRAAWKMTRGSFHRILGALAIALALALVISILGGLIVQAIAAVAGLPPTPPASLAEAFSPLRLVTLVVEGLLQTLSSVVMFAPAAVIWRGLSLNRSVEAF